MEKLPTLMKKRNKKRRPDLPGVLNIYDFFSRLDPAFGWKKMKFLNLTPNLM